MEVYMGLFDKKKQPPKPTEVTCTAEGCNFICSDASSLKKHMDWKHPELAKK